MGKELIKWWSVRHLLVLSLALNVGLLLRLFYGDRDSGWRASMGGGELPISSPLESSLERAHVSIDSAAASPSFADSAAAHRTDGDGDEGRILNLDHGDPTMYEKLWQQTGDKTSVSISGWQSVSYFSEASNLCWFLEPALATEIVSLHRLVANAVTDHRHIVVGTGSTQLFQAALYALSSSQPTHPIRVVSATPYYSFYKQVIEYLKSGLYEWAGDVSNIVNGDEPYIELVTAPNNPDGFMRKPVLNHSGGLLVHDYAYYWPQYTPITAPADHEIMLFTVSKSTGHAGMRIGWALAKDEHVARRMIKFIELSSIGVSKDSQLRAAKILRAVSDGIGGSANFFEVSYRQMAERWRLLREAVRLSDGLFSLPELPSDFCKYSNRSFKPQPAFAWLKCEGQEEDCQGFLRGHKLLTRSGTHFGVSPRFVRISMLDRDANFNLFIKRLSAMRR